MANSLYPSMLDKFIRKNNETGSQDGDYVMAEDVNELQSAIEKIESTLGVNPQGGYSSVAHKLNNIESSEVMTMPSIVFYKGSPKYANGISSDYQLSKAFSRFNYVILEDYDVENDSNATQVKDIIFITNSQHGTDFYIPINASKLGEFDMENIERLLLSAKSQIGIQGVYVYNLGFDHDNTREDQNKIIELVKSNDLNIIVSASDLDDLSNSKIHYMNPQQESISIDSRDHILDNDFGKSNGIYHSSSHINMRHEIIEKLKRELGCKILAHADIEAPTEEEFISDYFFLNSLAMIMSLDAFSINKTNREDYELNALPKIPLSVGYYDNDAEIQKRDNTWERYDDFGRLVVDIENHTFDYSGIKIPIKLIEFGIDKIKWENIDTTNMDFEYDGIKVVASVNDMGDYLEKIRGKRINYEDVGYDLVKSLNRYPSLLNEGEMLVKISSDLIEGLSMEEILAKVEENFKNLFSDMLIEYLSEGWLDANFNNLFANFLEATNAYFENVMADNADIKGLNAGVITAGKISSNLFEANTITGDKVTFLNDFGLNKWLGVLVDHNLIEDYSKNKLTPEIVNGISSARKLEALDSNIISTTDNIGALENYVVVWETNVLTSEDYQTNLHFSASDKANLFINNEAAIATNGEKVSSENMIAIQYSLNLKNGWNKIQVVQTHLTETNSMFNIGICLSDEANKNETDPGTSPIVRVDGYADKTTSISGSVIETGSITAKQIDVENLTAEIVKTDLLEAIEAHIKHIVSETGEFESLLADLLKANTIDTQNIRIVSEAKDENGDYGILLLDNAGMIISSSPRSIKPEFPATPSYELLTKTYDDTYSGSKSDWVYISSEKYAKVKLMDVYDNEYELDISYYEVDYTNGAVKIDSRSLMINEDIDISVYNKVYASYYYYDLEFPQDAHVVRINRLGVWVSSDGGRTFKTKLTGNGLVVETVDITNQAITSDKINDFAVLNAHIANAAIDSAKIKSIDAGKIMFGMLDLEAIDPETGETVQIATSGKCVVIDKDGIVAMDDNINPSDLVKLDQGGLYISEDGGLTWKSKLTGSGLVVENAEIESIEASKITTGSLSANTSIQVASKVFIDGKEGIILKDSSGETKILINENINISKGKLSIDDNGVERIILGNLENAYGLKLLMDNSYIILDKDGLRVSNGNFNIDKSGNVVLSGEIKANSGYFGSDSNKIAIDDSGLVLGTGSIVDTRDVASQKLNISSSGITAKAGNIGSVIITDDGLETSGVKISKDIEVHGDESIKITDGSIVIKDDKEVKMKIGSLGSLGYGIYTDLYDETTRTGTTIAWTESGITAKKENDLIFGLTQSGNLTLSGSINAMSGYLYTLGIQGQLTINTGGSIKAGETILDKYGITANAGTIGGWNINNSSISSNGLTLSSDGSISANGFYLGSSGVSATAGSIGGWVLGTSTFSSGEVIIDSANEIISIKDQVLLGRINDSSYGLEAGTVILDSKGLRSTSYTLNENGMTATKGLIGGWSITDNTLESGELKFNSATQVITIGDLVELKSTGYAKFGNILFNEEVESTMYNMYSPNFSITQDGNVYMSGRINATSGTFSGRIEALSGWFGNSSRGVFIDSYGLRAGFVSLNSNGLILTTQTGAITLSENGLIINESTDNFTTSINLNNKFIANKDGLKATRGHIGNWQIGDRTLGANEVILDSENEQIRIGPDITIGDIGDISKEYAIKIGESTKLNSNGIFTTSGEIGQWTIDEYGLINGAVAIRPHVISLSTNIVLQADGSAKLGIFNVNNDGLVYSGDSEDTAKFKVLTNGEIESTGGTIGGWNISPTKISGELIDLLPSGAIALGENNEVVIDSVLGIDVGLGTTTIDLGGNLSTTKLNANGGTIGNWVIDANSIKSSNDSFILDSESANLMIKSDAVNNSVVLGQFQYNNEAYCGLYAVDGIVGGWEVANNKISSSGISLISGYESQIILNDTVYLKSTGEVILNDQVSFSPDGSAAIGNLLIKTDGSIANSNDKFSISASGDVSLEGAIKSESGIIGGWNILSDQLTSGNMTLYANSNYSYISIGSSIRIDNDGTARFGNLNILNTGLNITNSSNNKVLDFNSSTGNLVISGQINSTSGNIGGFIIDENSITSPNVGGSVIKLYAGATSAIYIGGTTDETAKIYFNNRGYGKLGTLEINKEVDSIEYSLYSENFKIDENGNGYFNGSVYTNQGQVAGWKVSGSKIYVDNEIDGSEIGLDALEKRFYVTDANGDIVLFVDGDDGINVLNKFTVDTSGNLHAKSGTFGLSATDGVKISTNGLEVYGADGKIVAGDATLTRDGLNIRGNTSSIILGNNNDFSVNGLGYLVAKSGLIGGWNLGSDKLYSNNIEIKSSGEVAFGADKLTISSTNGFTTDKTTIDLTGKITTEQIEADGGIIAGWNIAPGSLSTPNVVIDAINEQILIGDNVLNGDSTGNIGSLNIASDGTISSLNNSFIINGTTGDASFTGEISASSGQIGGWEIGSNMLESSMSNVVGLYSSGSLKIGDGTQWKINLDSSGINVNSDIFTIDMDGVMTATTGYLGNTTNGVKINSDGISVIGTGVIRTSNIKLSDKTLTIYSGDTTYLTLGEYTVGSTKKLGLYGQGFELSSSGLNLSEVSNINIANRFKVDSSGNLVATNVDLSGNITATSGTFSGTINATTGRFGTTSNAVIIDSDGLDITSGRIKAGTVMLDSSGISGIGFILNQSGLNITSGQITLPGVTMNTTGLTITNGSINLGNKFIVNNLGHLSASSGKIGNWVLSDTALKSVSGNINLDSSNNKIEVYQNTSDTTKNKIVIEAGSVKIVNSEGLISTAMSAEGIHGQLLTDQSITGDKFDQIAPAKVSGVLVTSSIILIPSGEETVTQLSWNAVTIDADGKTCLDLAGYKIYTRDITRGDSDFYPVAIAYTNKYQLRGLRANAQYEFKISAYDVVGNEGLSSDTITHRVAKDNTPPDTVVIEKVMPGFKSLAVHWEKVNDYDLDYYEVQRKQKEKDSSTWTSFATISYSNTTSLLDNDLDYDYEYSYRIRAVDLSGNIGLFSGESTPVSPSKVGKTDIVAGTITAEELNIGSVVKSINTEKTTLFHFDGTLQSTQGYLPYVEVLEDNTRIPHQEGFFRREAKFGASVSIEEDTINLVAKVTENNANFRDNIRGWNISSIAVYHDHDGVDGIDDGYLEVGYSWDTYIEIPVESSNEDVYYNISLYSRSKNNNRVRVDIIPINGDLTKWEGSSGWSDNRIKVVIGEATTTDWKRYSSSFAIPRDSGTTIIRVVLTGYSQKDVVGIDNVQVEKRRFPTSFVNGEKNRGYIDYENNNLINADRGAISLWLNNNIGWEDTSLNSEGTTTDNLFMIGTPTGGYDVDNNSLYAKYDRETRKLSVKYNGVETYAVLSGINNEQWIHMVYTYKDQEQVLYINGVKVGRSNTSAISEFSNNLFRLGYMPRYDEELDRIIEEHEISEIPYGSRANCLFDEFRIDREVINVEELKSWYLQESSFYDAASQIDADSQNISAANASVVINNEGITVKDGKIDVSSEDGQVLITGGRLMVNGLDVGVAQSDNNVYNGNFTLEDSIYGIGDLKQTSRGVEQFGAKYWKVKRSKHQKYENAYLSVSWNSMAIDSVFDGSVIWDTIEDIVLFGAVDLYFMFTEEDFNPIVGIYSWSNFPENTPTAAYLNAVEMAYMQGAPFKSDMILKVTEYIALNSLAYHLSQNLSVNAIDKEILKNFISMMVETYWDKDWSHAGMSAPFSYTDGGVLSPLAKEAYITIILETIISSLTTIRYGLISSIYDEVKVRYDNLVNFKIGAAQFNTSDGMPKLTAYTIMTKDYIDRVFAPAYPHIEFIENGLYEVKSDTINKFMTGIVIESVTTEELMSDIDTLTGLPEIDMTSCIAPGEGGTFYHASINSHYLGRYGYAELGIDDEKAQWINLSQDISRLVCYTDGLEPDGTHFKQNNFSMHYVWDIDPATGEPIKSDDARIKFEVEEMIPRFNIVNDKAQIIPSYSYDAKSEEYYDSFKDPSLGGVSRIQAYYQYLLMVNPARANQIFMSLTHTDKCLIHNTALKPDGSIIQALEAGHSEEVGDVYIARSVRNVQTIALDDGVEYTHMALGITGKIKNGTCYYLLNEDGSVNMGKILTMSDGLVINQYTPNLKLVDFSTKPGWVNNVSDDDWVLGSSKMGDEASFSWNGNFEVDAKMEGPHGPDHGTMDILVNRIKYQVGTINNPNYSMQKTTDYTGFFSGPMMITIINRGQLWTDSPQIEDQSIFIGTNRIRLYDYHPIKDYLEIVNPEVVNMIDWDKNTIKITDASTDEWTKAYLLPEIANSKINGVPILPERTPVKYKVKIILEKDDTTVSQINSYKNAAYCKITAVQAELGKNPSYHRLSYGESSISGIQLQSYNKLYWTLSGIKTRHLEEHMAGYHRETGVYTRHMAEGAITSSKIAYEGVKNSNIANNNISYNKVRLQKKLLADKTCTLSDLAAWHHDSDIRTMNEYFELRPVTAGVPNRYYIQDPIEYNSEMLYENGQLLYSEDYIIKKKLGTCAIRDLSFVAGLYGEYLYDIVDDNKVYKYPLLKNLFDMGIRRPLVEAEINEFLLAVEITDLYDEPILDIAIKDSEALVYQISEITLIADEDQTDKYLITYWVEP